MVRDVATVAAVFAAVAAVATLPIVFGWIGVTGANRAGLAAVCVGAAATAVAQFILRSASSDQMGLLHPTVSVTIFVLGSFLMAAAVVFAGPNLGSVAVFYVEFMLLAFVLLRVNWAVAVTVFLLATYAGALIALDEPPAPAQQFINVLASAAVAGALVGGMARRLDLARRSLAGLNHHLEDRVAEQVDELERTGRLRRFLSPQVADLVTTRGAESFLEPHRCDIAVFFVDLRGFTQFTNAVPAERVVAVLNDYYAIVGGELERSGATIGGFDGDGVFAYLGDPLARVDSARSAAAMARAVALALDARIATWTVGTHTLGYGIGLSYGNAILGVVGYEGRSDYTPVGAVVNRASRLCDVARPGEILVDETFVWAAELGDEVERSANVELKGFDLLATYLVRH